MSRLQIIVLCVLCVIKITLSDEFKPEDMPKDVTNEDEDDENDILSNEIKDQHVDKIKDQDKYDKIKDQDMIKDQDKIKESIIDPDVFRDTMELIASRGFEAEEHKMITQDGYLITLHRIINPFVDINLSSKKPILCIHGLMDSSASFVMNSPGGFARKPNTDNNLGNDSAIIGNNLGFELSNHGYDVWLGNPRGSLYNHNEHINKNLSSFEFWNFSIDEMARYDIPAMINKIRQETKSDNVGYIGHSQGTGIMFALLADQPEYNNIIKPFIALAPVTHLQYTKSPLIQLARIPGAIKILQKLPIESFPPPHELFFNKIIVNMNCRSLGSWFCAQTVFLGVGFDEEQFDTSRFRVYGSHSPNPTSIQNLIHFVQIFKTGSFAKFDFGAKINQQKYGSSKPPIYDLSKITNTNIAIFYSDNDWCADPKDVNYLINSLKVPLVENYRIPYHKWNHMDFLWAKEAGKYINHKILEVLDRVHKS